MKKQPRTGIHYFYSMNTRLPILMFITILVIIAFQVYWVGENYEREKKTMQIKAGVAFRETIRELQTFNLRLPDSIRATGLHPPRQIFINKKLNTEDADIERSEVITMVNTLRKSMQSDSMKMRFEIASESISNNDRVIVRRTSDSVAFRYLYGLDALQDTLKTEAITAGLKKKLQEIKMNIPFTITRYAVEPKQQDELTDVVVGFVNPITYHLSIGNTFPYLLKRISLPLLFSLFLIAVTIISFVLVYRNMRRQHKLAEMKNDFINNITHELKTPIATVGVAIEAMKSFNAMDDQEKTKEYLDISANELQRLDMLVDNVLKISLFEKKQITLNKDALDLKQVASEVLDTMRVQFRKNNAVVHFQAETPVMITGDKLHIMSVIYNLLDNALKYKRSDPVIFVRLLEVDGLKVLQVEDNGIGIDPSYQSRIFDKFFRVPAGNNHTVKGYGLGLSYVAHIIEQHNGTISVESEAGKGSTFTIKFRQ